MIKKYTEKEYADKACEANAQGKMLYIYTHEEEIEKTEQLIETDDEGIPHEKEITIIETEEVEELLIGEVNYYVCYKDNRTDGTINPNYEEEKEQAEKERINMLSLTKREVFLALYKDKGIAPDQLRAQIQDTEALIEFDYAEKYYRGNPLINGIGAMLGYTSEQLDYLFENKEFPKTTESEEK